MSYLRFKLDLAIKHPLPQALKDELPALTAALRELKSYASKINAGKPNEEMSIKASWHICHNDEGLACEPEQEV